MAARIQQGLAHSMNAPKQNTLARRFDGRRGDGLLRPRLSVRSGGIGSARGGGFAEGGVAAAARIVARRGGTALAKGFALVGKTVEFFFAAGGGTRFVATGGAAGALAERIAGFFGMPAFVVRTGIVAAAIRSRARGEGPALALGFSEFIASSGIARLIAAILRAEALAKAFASGTPRFFRVLGPFPWPVTTRRRAPAQPKIFAVFVGTMRPLAGACALFHAAIELVGLTSASKFRYVTFFPAPVEGWPSG